MGKQRRNWSVEEKLAIVLAVLSGRQSVAEISRQRGVNENQIYRWKEQFLEAGRQGLNASVYPQFIHLQHRQHEWPQKQWQTL